MKTLHFLSTLAFTLLFLCLSATAANNCNDPNGVLNTTYAWQMDGLLVWTQGAQTTNFAPLATAGSLTFDGKGDLSGEHDTNLGGLLIPHTDTGSYNVNPDCETGTMSLSNGLTLSFVIVGKGKKLKLGSTAPGGVSSGTLSMMPAACSADTLASKTYGYSTHGFRGKGKNFPRRIGFLVPFANVGHLAFAPDGTLSGVNDLNLGGKPYTGQPITGTYTVNSDCTGSATMTVGGKDQSIHFVILDGADEVIFVSTPTGSLWSGTLTQE